MSHFLLTLVVIKVTEQTVSCGATCSFLSFSCEAFGYRHSYVNTVQSTCESVRVCVFAMCIRMWECTQKAFEVPHSLYTPLTHVSSLFEDHVAMIIKAALFPLQTYGMNMDMIWHQTFRQHPSLSPAVCWSLMDAAILEQSLWELNLSFSSLSRSIATSSHFIHTAGGSVLLRCSVSSASFQTCAIPPPYNLLGGNLHSSSLSTCPSAAGWHDNIVLRRFCIHALAHKLYIVKLYTTVFLKSTLCVLYLSQIHPSLQFRSGRQGCPVGLQTVLGEAQGRMSCQCHIASPKHE